MFAATTSVDFTAPIAAPLRLRARLIADSLGISQAALFTARCGESAVRLHAPDWAELLRRLPAIGRCVSFPV
jgi:putative heme degradation protein